MFNFSQQHLDVLKTLIPEPLYEEQVKLYAREINTVVQFQKYDDDRVDINRDELKRILTKFSGRVRKAKESLLEIQTKNGSIASEFYNYYHDGLKAITQLDEMQLGCEKWQLDLSQKTEHKNKPLFLTSRIKLVWEKTTNTKICIEDLKFAFKKNKKDPFIETLKIVLEAAGHPVANPYHYLAKILE